MTSKPTVLTHPKASFWVVLGMAFVLLCLLGWSSALPQKVVSSLESVVQKESAQMTLVFDAPLSIHGLDRRTLALGTDMCPGQERGLMRAIFGETGNAGRRECVVISPDVDRVKVLLHAQNAPPKEEVWSVHRHEGRVSFERLDGTAVVATIE